MEWCAIWSVSVWNVPSVSMWNVPTGRVPMCVVDVWECVL